MRSGNETNFVWPYCGLALRAHKDICFESTHDYNYVVRLPPHNYIHVTCSILVEHIKLKRFSLSAGKK